MSNTSGLKVFVLNLAAAVLCTAGTGVCALAMLLAEPTPTNTLSAQGCAVATLGGLAWTIAALLSLRSYPNRPSDVKEPMSQSRESIRKGGWSA